MERKVGTISMGVRCPIIREGDNIAELVTQSVLEAAEYEGFSLRDRDVIAITESNSRVKIGNLAENISGKTVLNDDFDLYGIDNEYVIVLFWSYTCPHCHDILIQLKEFLDNNDNFSLVSVCVKGKHNKIKRFVKKYKIRGFFYHDGLEWNSPTINDYAVTSTPSIFILNNEKIIVSKPFDFNDIMNLIK